MNKRDLPPRALVLDLVLRWADKLGTVGTACVPVDGVKLASRQSTLLLTTHNHRKEHVMLSVAVHFDGEPADSPPRFVLFKLGPTVWKLSPSVLDDRLHAYVTVTGVPDPAPWESPPAAAP